MSGADPGDDESQAEVLARELGLFWAVAEPSLPPVPEQPEQPDQEGIRLGVGLLSRIDYVLARPGTPQRPVQVERAFTIDTPVDGLPPSDHYPVVVDLDLG